MLGQPSQGDRWGGRWWLSTHQIHLVTGFGVHVSKIKRVHVYAAHQSDDRDHCRPSPFLHPAGGGNSTTISFPAPPILGVRP